MSNPRSLELQKGMRQSHGSFELVVSPLILGLLGFWADRSFGLTPVLTIVAVCVGILGAVTKIVFQYRFKMSEIEKDAPWVS